MWRGMEGVGSAYSPVRDWPTFSDRSGAAASAVQTLPSGIDLTLQRPRFPTLARQEQPRVTPHSGTDVLRTDLWQQQTRSRAFRRPARRGRLPPSARRHLRGCAIDTVSWQLCWKLTASQLAGPVVAYRWLRPDLLGCPGRRQREHRVEHVALGHVSGLGVVQWLALGVVDEAPFHQ